MDSECMPLDTGLSVQVTLHCLQQCDKIFSLSKLNLILILAKECCIPIRGLKDQTIKQDR